MPHRALWAAALCVALAIPSAEARPRSLLDGFTKAFQTGKVVKRHPTKVSPARYRHRPAKPKPIPPNVGNADLDRYDAAPRVGRASFYGDGERLSSLTASGERFNPMGDTCAHRRAKFGVLIRVTNLDNGKTATCRVNDRGPAAWTGRILDVSKGIAAQLGMLKAGVARVSIVTITD